MKRNGVSNSSGSVSRTLRSSWTLIVEARETNCISSCPTPPQSLPSFELYFTRPMKKVACLSSSGLPEGGCTDGYEADEACEGHARSVADHTNR